MNFMNELVYAFRKCRSEMRTAIIPFITAGDPSPAWTIRIVETLAEEGASVIELGVPFSDPIADGVTIQASSERALRSGVKLKETLKIARECREECGLPIVLLSYLNPLYRMGLSNFFEQASSAGISGVIVPDLPIEEAGEFIEMAKRHGVSTIFLASPTTSDERLERIVKSSTGFVYLVSVKGVTGARERISEDAFILIRRARRIAGRPPIAVGFGVSSPAHVEMLAKAGSEGVIIGSALIKVIEQNLTDINKCLDMLKNFIRPIIEVSRIDNYTLWE